MRHLAGLALSVLCSGMAWAGMPAAQQTELIQKYCAVCHSDAHRNGGLSLDRFDAARVDPSLAAMLMSKLTDGVSLATARASATDEAAHALLVAKMKSGAMGASGLKIPDRATQDALVAALAEEAAGAEGWHAEGDTVSTLREVPSASKPGESNLYRLSLSCNAEKREGSVLLTWAPNVPGKDATVSVVGDGKLLYTAAVEGSEKMFRGATGASGTGGTILKLIELPERSLTVANLFPGEQVEFLLDDLPLSSCFWQKVRP